jgi:hypothetical protein
MLDTFIRKAAERCVLGNARATVSDIYIRSVLSHTWVKSFRHRPLNTDVQRQIAIVKARMSVLSAAASATAPS